MSYLYACTTPVYLLKNDRPVLPRMLFPIVPIRTICTKIVYLLLIFPGACNSYLRLNPNAIMYNFDDGAQDWRVEGNSITGAVTNPKFDSNKGNLGGCLVVVDDAPSLWFFSAPAELVKKMASCYGKAFMFDIKVSSADQRGNTIILQGDKIQLTYSAANAPGPTWTTYYVKLDETGPWFKNASATIATKAEVQEVLQSLQKVLIRGDYKGGPDTGMLDNVWVQ